MHIIFGILSLGLTLICLAGGLIHATFHRGLGGPEKFISMTFWLVPLGTSVACFNPPNNRRSINNEPPINPYDTKTPESKGPQHQMVTQNSKPKKSA